MATDPLAGERDAIRKIYVDTIGAINEAHLSHLAFFSLVGVMVSQVVMNGQTAEAAHALTDQLAKSTHDLINAKLGN